LSLWQFLRSLLDALNRHDQTPAPAAATTAPGRYDCAATAAPTTAAASQQPEERIKLVFLTSVNVDTEGYDVNDNPYVNYLRDT
jgi:hypothetical protein